MNCETGSFSRLSTECQKCENKNLCNNKRMVSEAYIIPNSQPNMTSNININIGNQFVNQKDILEQLNKSFELNCSFNKR
jgi:hypothetical protein